MPIKRSKTISRLEEAYNLAWTHSPEPSMMITSRKGLRIMLRKLGWDKNRIRRYLYAADRKEKVLAKQEE